MIRRSGEPLSTGQRLGIGALGVIAVALLTSCAKHEHQAPPDNIPETVQQVTALAWRNSCEIVPGSVQDLHQIPLATADTDKTTVNMTLRVRKSKVGEKMLSGMVLDSTTTGTEPGFKVTVHDPNKTIQEPENLPEVDWSDPDGTDILPGLDAPDFLGDSAVQIAPEIAANNPTLKLDVYLKTPTQGQSEQGVPVNETGFTFCGQLIVNRGSWKLGSVASTQDTQVVPGIY